MGGRLLGSCNSGSGPLRGLFAKRGIQIPALFHLGSSTGGGRGLESSFLDAHQVKRWTKLGKSDRVLVHCSTYYSSPIAAKYLNDS